VRVGLWPKLLSGLLETPGYSVKNVAKVCRKRGERSESCFILYLFLVFYHLTRSVLDSNNLQHFCGTLSKKYETDSLEKFEPT